jgi:hypothetical protein
MKTLKQTATMAFSLLAAAAFAADEPTADEIIQKARAAYAALSSYSDSGTVVTVSSGQTISLEFDTRLQRPNLYRVNWTQKKGLMPGMSADNGMAWSGGNGDFYQTTCSWAGNGPVAKKKMPDMKGTLGGSIGYSLFATTTIPGAFFGRNLDDYFAYPAIDGKFPLTKQKSEKVGDVDCYVIAAEADLSKYPEAGKSGSVSNQLWIGKNDFLIHKTSVRYFEKVDDDLLQNDEVIDQAAKKTLEMQSKPVTPEAIAALRPKMREMMKQMQPMMKSAFKEGVLYIQTHENISVNQSYSPADLLPAKD